MKKVCVKIVIMSLFIGLIAMNSSSYAERSVEVIKADILNLAESFEGQGDPDFKKQNALDVLVNELLEASPQPPLKDRIDLLQGPWWQVWGPYDYRNDDRGIDPKTTVDEIYQVVFEDGYYYNVNPIKGKDTIALLRGEYELVSDEADFLKVRFVSFPGNKGRPGDIDLWELPALAEADQLPNKKTIVPGIIVSLFFGGGYLREVYTDEDMRITYGGKKLQNRERESIYIMTRPSDDQQNNNL